MSAPDQNPDPRGIFTSRIALGLAALGRPGYLNLGHGQDVRDASVEAMRATCWELLDVAYAAGVRHVDAARSYGLAEEFLGGWLAERAYDDVAVSSKWGYTYTADWQPDAAEHEVKDLSLDTFRRQVGETRALLPRLDAYLIHSATLESGVLEDPSVLAALGRLGESGVIIGLSLSGPQQAEALRAAIRLSESGAAPFHVVQATWNVLEPSVGSALTGASEAGWTVVVKEALANGRLTERGDPPAAVSELATDRGVGVDAAAIAVALAQPFKPVVLSGAARADHLLSNLRALELELSPEDAQACLAEVEDAETYWSRRSSLPWT